MDNEEHIIDLQLCSDKILVWKAEDVKTIREKHNIVGKLIGCLPRSPQQNLQLGLPLQLMSEEAAVLIEYGVARIINIKVVTPTTEDVEKFEEDRLKSFIEQNQIFQSDRESKKMEILEKNRSSYGKKKKQLRKERAKSRKILLTANVEKMDMEVIITTEITNVTNAEDDEMSNPGNCCKREIDDLENNAKRQKIMVTEDEQSTTNSENSEKRKSHQINDVNLQPNEQDDCSKTTNVENESNLANNSNHGVKQDKQIIDNRTLDGRSIVCDVECNNSNAATVLKKTGNEPMVNRDSESGKVNEKEDCKEYQGCLIHLPTCATELSRIPVEEWNYPSSEAEWLRFCVFKDFWEKGYHLTSGGKFGGDFLVYPGNPLLFHSSYIAICRPHTESFSTLELVQFGRMASNVRKTVIICSLDAQDKLVFTSVQWTGVS